MTLSRRHFSSQTHQAGIYHGCQTPIHPIAQFSINFITARGSGPTAIVQPYSISPVTPAIYPSFFEFLDFYFFLTFLLSVRHLLNSRQIPMLPRFELDRRFCAFAICLVIYKIHQPRESQFVLAFTRHFSEFLHFSFFLTFLLSVCRPST